MMILKALMWRAIWMTFFPRLLMLFIMTTLYAEDDTIRREDVYNERGLLAHEYYYREGQLLQSIQFFYNTDDQLTTTDLFEDSLLKERSRYIYKVDGSLWRVDKNDQLSFYTRNLILNQLSDEFKVVALEKGALVAINSYHDGQLKRGSDFYYEGDSLVLARFVDGSYRLDEHYNKVGHRIKAIYYYDDTLLEELNYSYDSEGLLTEEHHFIESPDKERREKERLIYLYDDEKKIKQIDKYRGVELYQSTIYSIKGREERYYKDGRMVFSEQYSSTKELIEEN